MNDRNQPERRRSMEELAAEIKFLNEMVQYKLNDIDKKLDVVVRDTESYGERIRKLEEKQSTIKGYFLGLGALGAVLSDKITKLLT